MKLSQAVILSEREPKGFERVEGSPEFSGEFIVRITLWLRGVPRLGPRGPSLGMTENSAKQEVTK